MKLYLFEVLFKVSTYIVYIESKKKTIVYLVTLVHMWHNNKINKLKPITFKTFSK